YGHGVGDTVCSRLVRVEDAVEFHEVGLVFGKEGTRQDVAQQQHDADDFVGFDATRDDAFGEISGVSLQSFEGSGFQSLHVAIVNGCGFSKDFVLGHGGQQAGFGDASDPLFTELCAVLTEVGDELAKKLGGTFAADEFRIVRSSHYQIFGNNVTSEHL